MTRNQVLTRFVQQRPTTLEAMLRVEGVTPLCVERYGKQFLKLIRQFGNTTSTVQKPAVAVAQSFPPK